VGLVGKTSCRFAQIEFYVSSAADQPQQAKKAQEEKQRKLDEEAEKEAAQEREKGIPDDENGLFRKMLDFVKEGETALSVKYKEYKVCGLLISKRF
jgi:hypothetical protein